MQTRVSKDVVSLVYVRWAIPSWRFGLVGRSPCPRTLESQGRSERRASLLDSHGSRQGVEVLAKRGKFGMVGFMRRALPVVAVVLVVAVAATDWPLGWSYWAEHPLVAAIVGGAALLVLAGTAFDAYVARRERARWHQVAWAASSDFALLFEDAWLSMVRLIGVNVTFEPFMQAFCAKGYQRAVSEFGTGRLTQKQVDQMTGDPPDLPDEFIRSRVAVLTGDQEWLDAAMLDVRIVLRRHSEAVSRWAGTTTLLRDEAFMRAVTASIATIDKLVVVMNLIDWVTAPGREGRDRFTNEWIALHRAFRRENAVWLQRVYHDASAARQVLGNVESWLDTPAESD